MEDLEYLVQEWMRRVGAAIPPSTMGPQHSAKHALCTGPIQPLPAVSSVQLWLSASTLPEPLAKVLPHCKTNASLRQKEGFTAPAESQTQGSRSTTNNRFHLNTATINVLFLSWPCTATAHTVSSVQ